VPQNQRSQTIRINFDDTLTPTLLLHLGAGLMLYDQNQYPAPINAGQLLGWAANQQYAANTIMPQLNGLSSIFSGGLALGQGFGAPAPGVGFPGAQDDKNIKPTANASMTWVKGSHTFKWGAEMVVEGNPAFSSNRSNGIYGFAVQETQNPWEYTSAAIGPSSVFTSGNPYASFLLGSPDYINASAITDSRLGHHSIGLFMQDNWKVTRKLTLELGLRYDYATLLEEQYGRMQSANFQKPNPNLVPADSTTPLDGIAVYQKQYNQNYPFAFGPRIGVAYQIDSKTVFRAGGGIAYSTSSVNQGFSTTDTDFVAVTAPEGTGQGLGYTGPGVVKFANGNPFAPGNIYGNGPLTNPLTGPNFPTQVSTTGCGPATGPGAGQSPCIPVESPFITIDKGTGRLPRIFQWSIGLQREIIPNLLIEAAYVGNRGAWWEAPTLDAEAYNGLTPAGLLAERQYGNTTGINVNNPAQLALLTEPISSPAVIAAFPLLANPDNVYKGFPSYELLNQALRPHPQWIGVPPFLGPPLGRTWYDSLQVKLTKRYSHGLTVQASYTFQKELTNGANANTAYLTPDPPIINDVNNLTQNKQISGLDHPQVMVVTFTYTTPKNKFGGDGFGGRTLQWLSRDWTFGGVLRYQSGQILQTPPSENNFLYQLGVGSQDNPAIWGQAAGLENYVPGQPFFSVNPNSHFDPSTTLVLNPKAFTDAPAATYGVSAPYYINNRWQRQPGESLSVARTFRVREKYQLQIRAEFQNVFNRVFYAAPADGPGTGTYSQPAYANPFPVVGSTSGALSGGYGFVNSFNGAGTSPRTGQLVARFTF
jgi:hypothetical protein